MRMALILVASLAACSPPADAPDLSARDASGQPWPRLVPLDRLLKAPPMRTGPEQEIADQTRAERLRARANALSGPSLISPEDRARIEQAERAGSGV